MKNKNKMRKQVEKMTQAENVFSPLSNNYVDSVLNTLDLENIQEMDRLSEKLGIVKYSDYIRMQDEEARRSGVITCDCCGCRSKYPNYS